MMLVSISKQEPAEAAERFLSLLPLLSPVQIRNVAASGLFLALLLFALAARAEVAPVAIRVPQTKAWTGQRVPFFVELRARGSFGGAASFSLPQVPRTVILKTGNPIVSSQEIEGEIWFVQTHEFALFSQQTGTVEIPAFAVRYGARDGFTGPVKDVETEVPAARVEIQRPPGSDQLGFLITSESFEVTETWEPQPGPAEVGAIFKRTIVQRARQMTGMALAAAPSTAPDGVRVYLGQAEVTDNTQRGEFLGERRETITYLLQEPGTVELPAITYVWWNPKTEKLLSKILPVATIKVTAPPAPASAGQPVAALRVWPWLLAGILAMAAGAWQRRRLAGLAQRCWRGLNPPDRVAARKLLRACRRHDAAAAHDAWIAWRNTRGKACEMDPDFRAAVLNLQRHLFGPATGNSWCGEELRRGFVTHRDKRKPRRERERRAVLPVLNPPP